MVSIPERLRDRSRKNRDCIAIFNWNLSRKLTVELLGFLHQWLGNSRNMGPVDKKSSDWAFRGRAAKIKAEKI